MSSFKDLSIKKENISIEKYLPVIVLKGNGCNLQENKIKIF